MKQSETTEFAKCQINILGILADIQQDSAPIELSIGHTGKDNYVYHGSIVIKSAPPIVSKRLLELGYNLDITPQGVRVSTF